MKVFHQSAGQRSQPQPAEIAILVGGSGIGKMIPGLYGHGKQFVIAGVTGARLALLRSTGPAARIKLDIVPTCQANPDAVYWVRASAVIRGSLRRVFGRGDCKWVLEVLAHRARAIHRTTLIFQN